MTAGMGIAAWVVLVLVHAVPAAGDPGGEWKKAPGLHSDERKILLSLRLAETRNRAQTRSYYRSLARRWKSGSTPVPLLRRGSRAPKPVSRAPRL